MAHEEATLIVNQMIEQLSGLARTIADALKDKKISPMEGFSLGMRGMTLASFVITAMESADVQEVMWVLEHGYWALPPEAPARP